MALVLRLWKLQLRIKQSRRKVEYSMARANNWKHCWNDLDLKTGLDVTGLERPSIRAGDGQRTTYSMAGNGLVI